MSILKDRAPILVLLGSACVIGLAAVLARVTGTGPAAAGFWRLTFALPWLGLMTMRSRRGHTAPSPPMATAPRWLGPAPGMMALCGALFAADIVCWHYSLRLTSVANSTVLANMTPVVVTLLAWVFFREAPARLFLAGLALAVGGAVLMAGTAHSSGSGSNAPLGNLLAVITTVWYALYFLAVSKTRKTATAVQVMTGSTLVGAPLLLLAAIGLHERLTPGALAGWGACIALGVVHVAGQGGVTWALGKVPTALAAIVVLVQPVVAALLSWAMFGEAITPLQGLGGALALCGVALAQLSARTKTPPTQGEAVALAP
jgi:drug/metabolite transporter (DMT)-like permease